MRLEEVGLAGAWGLVHFRVGYAKEQQVVLIPVLIERVGSRLYCRVSVLFRIGRSCCRIIYPVCCLTISVSGPATFSIASGYFAVGLPSTQYSSRLEVTVTQYSVSVLLCRKVVLTPAPAKCFINSVTAA